MAGTVPTWRRDGVLTRQANAGRHGVLRAARRAVADAWDDGEKFYDVVVLLSVGLFFLVALGVGIIALQSR